MPKALKTCPIWSHCSGSTFIFIVKWRIRNITKLSWKNVTVPSSNDLSIRKDILLIKWCQVSRGLQFIIYVFTLLLLSSKRFGKISKFFSVAYPCQFGFHYLVSGATVWLVFLPFYICTLFGNCWRQCCCCLCDPVVINSHFISKGHP